MELLSALVHLATTGVLGFIGARLLMPARAGRRPERLLGVHLALIFFGYTSALLAVSVAGGAPAMSLLAWCGSVAAAAASILLLCFVRRVFRPEARWAGRLTWATALAIAVLPLVDTTRAAWPRVDMGQPLYWLASGLGKVGMVWLLAECMVRARRAGGRLRFGRGDPVHASRMRLFGLHASLIIALDGAVVSASAYALEYGRTSMLLDVTIAALLASSVLSLVVAFVQPAWYRARVARMAEALAPRGSDRRLGSGFESGLGSGS